MTEEIIINAWQFEDQDFDYISECIQAELIDRGYFVPNVESFSWNVSVTIFAGDMPNEV
tara:strand:+ start:291 stop:467 length:177 start_codon:yes stop_codon:yes gene_type:complete